MSENVTKISEQFVRAPYIESYVDATSGAIRNWWPWSEPIQKDGVIGYPSLSDRGERPSSTLPLLETISRLRTASDDQILKVASQIGPLLWYRYRYDRTPLGEKLRRTDHGAPDPGLFPLPLGHDPAVWEIVLAEWFDEWRDFATCVHGLLQVFLALSAAPPNEIALLRAMSWPPYEIEVSQRAFAQIEELLRGVDLRPRKISVIPDGDEMEGQGFSAHQPNNRINRWLHIQHLTAPSPQELGWKMLTAYVNRMFEVGLVGLQGGFPTHGPRTWRTTPVARSLVGAVGVALSERFAEVPRTSVCEHCGRAYEYTTKAGRNCPEHRHHLAAERSRRSRAKKPG